MSITTSPSKTLTKSRTSSNPSPSYNSLNNSNALSDELSLITLDTVLLHYRQQEIQTSAMSFTLVYSLLGYINEALESLEGEYTSVKGNSEKQIHLFQKVLDNHGCELKSFRWL